MSHCTKENCNRCNCACGKCDRCCCKCGCCCCCLCRCCPPPKPCPECPECPCKSRGELVKNGGFEEWAEGGITIRPVGWSVNGFSERVSERGKVHTGRYSVQIPIESSFAQTIPIPQEECFFEFSFFARSVSNNPGLRATLSFLDVEGSLLPEGAIIFIERGDLPNVNGVFNYYRVITSQAPLNAVAVRIQFETIGADQLVIIDDVSLKVA